MDEPEALFDFREALRRLKKGDRVARQGWNGKGMYIYLYTFQHDDPVFEPCIVMHTAQGREQPGWLASQADLLALDWTLVSRHG
jgi:hypothetical protein